MYIIIFIEYKNGIRKCEFYEVIMTFDNTADNLLFIG